MPSPYNPWQDVFNQMDRWFLRGPGHGGSGTVPRVNAWHDEANVVLTAEVPGLGPDDLEVTVEAETLTIAGEVKRDPTDDKVNWHRAERAPGKFRRQFILPFRVDADSVVATCKDGILSLQLHRCATEAPRQISIQAG